MEQLLELYGVDTHKSGAPVNQLFLRHLDGCMALRPTSSVRALEELQRRWPGYRKALSASELATRLDEAAVLRAAESEATLATLLAALEFGRD